MKKHKPSAHKTSKKAAKSKKKIVRIHLTTKKHHKHSEKPKPRFRNGMLKAITKEEFLQIGLNGFDDLFNPGYGIPAGSSILIEGGPGSGKTIFCLAAVNELCRQGKKCLYMSFEEPEANLINHMELFRYHANDYIKEGKLKIKRFEAIDVSRSVEALLSAAKRELLIDIDPVLFPHDFKPDFVVIDSLTSIASAFSGHQSRFRIYMEQLFRYLEKNNITTFLIREVATPTHVGSSYKEEGEAVSFLSDGIVVLYNVIYKDGRRASALEILKMRGSSFKKKIVKIEIKPGKGMVIHSGDMLKETARNKFQLT